jgi:hypothetical protein
MRHLPMLTLALATAALVAGSCTVDASVATDRAGRVVAVEAVRLVSTLRRLTVALAVDAGGPVLEFVWTKGAEARGR